uniref:Uncharacterized protein n=1 Tax=Anguilla anguilla TaxID=7936 RepID=A0A0E9PGE3_ANGAN
MIDLVIKYAEGEILTASFFGFFLF